MSVSRLLAAAFFVIFLAAGIAVHGDYGISCDEPIQRSLGRKTFGFVFERDLSLLSAPNVYHGPAFTYALYALEKAIGADKDSARAYRWRHRATFALFFAALLAFYALCRDHFGGPRWALLGTAYLALSPRIFADSFYNPKDLPFLSLFVIASWALLRFLDRRGLRDACLFGAAAGLATGVRLAGLLLPAFALAWLLFDRRRPGRHAAVLAGTVAASFAVSLAAAWPLLAFHPEELFAALRRAADYPHVSSELYFGRYIRSTNLPWHYLPVWIAITTPVSCVAAAAAGLFLGNRPIHPSDRVARDRLFVSVWLLLPVMTAIGLGSTLYDGWRHFYFVYPAVVLLAVAGLREAGRLCEKLPRAGARIVPAVLAAVVALDLGSALFFIVRNHPHQMLYFNALAGGVKGAHGRFKGDYWAMTTRTALREILRRDGRAAVRVERESTCGSQMHLALDGASRARLRMVAGGGDYLYANEKEALRRPDPPLFTVDVDGAPVSAVYLLREST